MVEGSDQWTNEDLKELHRLLNDKAQEIFEIFDENYSNHELMAFAVMYLINMAPALEDEAFLELMQNLGRRFYAASMPSLPEIRQTYGIQQVQSDSPEATEPPEPTLGQPQDD